jgi:hypothetical protein
MAVSKLRVTHAAGPALEPYVVNGQGMTCQTLMIEKVPVGPTRYRDVVLTSWDRRLSPM